MLEELEPLLNSQLPGSAVNYVRNYPSPRDLGGLLIGAEPHLVFLDVASDHVQAMQLLGEMARLGSGVQVLALLTGNDPDLILRCLRTGAAGFSDSALYRRPARGRSGQAGAPATLRRISRQGTREDFRRHARQGRLRRDHGGLQSGVPVEEAWAPSASCWPISILLAGTLSFLLKIKSVYSFLDVLLRAKELDMDLWNAMVTPVNGVDVLLAPELIADGMQDLRDPSPILDYARHVYDVVVIDAGGVYGEWNLNQARQASELLLVTTNELPALQAAQRALSYLDTNRIGRWKVRLVVNRYHRDVGLSREVIGTALHTEVFDSLPSDYEAVQHALMEGKPIPASTPFGKGIMQLADRLSGRSEGLKKPSSLGGLFGLFSKTSKS